ncbi:FliO/MopB family protein [Amphiplicatus metriothermophilus]|uniref:Flagellar protein FliO/FliZ n=1 Tax=Amphiplicatus metriothermophilus TaxID=1519374 RepID=A0A239PSZ6_9PROT|nr:flagellar biosynthetic protein FliO [Amphiplicatus metriothermophilus]MBB5519189.1 flagellar protein FliO/FliZ [Amphiplicatus metriothermophilus]SNT73258.1 flagellar protein FliO/FliZ [Amphiplicatus metriothermophilus]
MDLLSLSRIFFALLLVIGLIAVCALAARRLGLAQGAAALGRKRRLALVETLALDARRRLAIIRCDGREHLVVLGPAGETVIARGLPALEPEETDQSEAPSFAAAMARLKAFGPARNPFRGGGAADAA